MKAIVYDSPGRLRVDERREPEIQDGDVLVRVAYAGICGTDLSIWAGGLSRVRPPVVLGHECVGLVEAISGGGADCAPGDAVAVEPLLPCGACLACRSGHYHVYRRLRVIGVDVDDGMARVMRAPIERVHRLPSGLPLEVAALTEPLAVAVHMVGRAAPSVGDIVLVLGAGPVGLLVGLVARATGAGRVAITELNDYRARLARAYGFDVLRPDRDDVEDTVLDWTDGEGADVTFELTGSAGALAQVAALTRVRGRILLGGIAKGPAALDVQAITLKEQHLLGSRVYTSRDFARAIDLLARDRIDVRPLISAIVPLMAAIDDGFAPLKSGADLMKVLVRPEDGD